MTRTPLWLALAACASSEEPVTACEPGGGLSTNAAGDTLVIGCEWLEACAAAPDCVVVSTSCDGCCQEGAILAEREAEYGPARTAACGAFEGGVCDCDAEPMAAACVDGRCALVRAR